VPRIDNAIYETPHDASCGCGASARAKRKRVLEPVSALRAAPEAMRWLAHVGPGSLAADAAASQCRPYLKIEKDQPRFLACQKIADQIGAVTTSKRAFALLEPAFGGNVAERFGVLTLDTHLKMRGLWETGAGETDSVQAPRVPTLQAAIVDDAAAAIIVHVHPAASDWPSDADIGVTRMFAVAFALVGVYLEDHIIVAVGSPHGYYSFADSMPQALELDGLR
jgi:proteasome lid subunit RPN8/RPN11